MTDGPVPGASPKPSIIQTPISSAIQKIDGRTGAIVFSGDDTSRIFGNSMVENEHELVASVRKFVSDKDKIRDTGVRVDRDPTHPFPTDIMKEAYDMGLVNMTVPSQHGGAGLSTRVACFLIEELAFGCSGITTSLMANDLALRPILLAGNEAQIRAFVKDLVIGKKLASFCLTEPNAGSNVAEMTCSLADDGDHYVLRGTKQWITNGGVADQLTVFARIKGTEGHKGICCIVVPTGNSKIKIGKPEHKLGQHASNTVELSFDEVRVPKANLIGQVGEGFKIAMATLDHSRPMTAMIGVGIARACLETAVGYAMTRVVGGEALIDKPLLFPHFAEMKMQLDAMRLLSIDAACRLDLGYNSGLHASEAKLHAGQAVRDIAERCLQLHGGNGFSEEYLPAKLLRDSMVLGVYEGTNEVQQIVIARELKRGYRQEFPSAS